MTDFPEHDLRPPEAPRRRWPERGDDRYLGGVAGALARAVDVDPMLVRVAIAAGVLYMPWLVVLYALAWLVLPDDRSHRSLLADAVTPHGWPAAAGVTALGLGAALIAPMVGPGGDLGVTQGVLLLGLGILLITGRGGRAVPGHVDGDTPTAGSPAPATGEPARPDPTGAESIDATRSAATATTNAPLWRWRPPRRPPRPPRPSSTLGWLGLSALVVLIGALVAVDQGWKSVSPGVAVSLCLLLVGMVLAVAAWRGRARLLMPVGVLLLPLWAGFAVTNVPRYQGDGDRNRVVKADDPFPSRVSLGYGTLDVDLSHASFPAGAHRRLRLGLTAGRARVDVPRAVHLDIRGDVGLGAVQVYDGWRTDGQGPVWPTGVSLRLGDPRQRCLTATYGDDGVEGNESAGRTTSTTRVEHYDDMTGQPCVVPKRVKDPATLQLTLDVGIGDVEVHRV